MEPPTEPYEPCATESYGSRANSKSALESRSIRLTGQYAALDEYLTGYLTMLRSTDVHGVVRMSST